MVGQYQVDEHGRCYGFSTDDDSADAGYYGDSLEIGQEVTIDDGRVGVISTIHGHIHTGSPGQSNYVCVDIDL